LRKQCNACGGIYQDAMPDGTRYFHACPPERIVELEGQVDDDGKQLSARLGIPAPRDENVVLEFEVLPERLPRVVGEHVRSEGLGARELKPDEV